MMQEQSLVKIHEGWDCPAGIPEGRSGQWRVKFLKKEAGVYPVYKQIAGADFAELPNDGRITVLQEKRGSRYQDWMTDDILFWYAMRNIAERSHGNVLVGGLGLGLILRHLAYGPGTQSVKTITVVEKSRDVVRLVWPTLKPFLEDSGILFDLEVADFFQWQSVRDYDTVITDFWVGRPETKQVQDLFLRTYNLVSSKWPDATALYHGLGAWPIVLDKLRSQGIYLSKKDQRMILVDLVGHARTA